MYDRHLFGGHGDCWKAERVGLSNLDALENGRLGELGFSKIANILDRLPDDRALDAQDCDFDPMIRYFSSLWAFACDPAVGKATSSVVVDVVPKLGLM